MALTPDEIERLPTRLGELNEQIDILERAVKTGTTDRLNVADELAALYKERGEIERKLAAG